MTGPGPGPGIGTGHFFFLILKLAIPVPVTSPVPVTVPVPLKVPFKVPVTFPVIFKDRSCPGQVPVRSRSCPGTVPVLSRTGTGQVPDRYRSVCQERKNYCNQNYKIIFFLTSDISSNISRSPGMFLFKNSKKGYFYCKNPDVSLKKEIQIKILILT